MPFFSKSMIIKLEDVIHSKVENYVLGLGITGEPSSP